MVFGHSMVCESQQRIICFKLRFEECLDIFLLVESRKDITDNGGDTAVMTEDNVLEVNL